MAYDPSTGDVLLFGGYNGTSYLGDTWEFSNATYTWSEVCSSCGPSPRAGATLTYANGSLVLFGGYNGTSYLGDTWTWYDGTWSQACTSSCTSPPPRAYASSSSGAGFIFGGYNGTSYLDDTWFWSGSTWTELAQDSSCGTASYPNCALPPARASATVSYDSTLGYIVAGGYNGGYLTDVWALVGYSDVTSPTAQSRWVKVCGSCAPAGTGGAQEYLSSIAEPIIFGGYNGTSYLGETDAFAGATWYYQRDPTSELTSTVTNPLGTTASTSYTYSTDGLVESKVVTGPGAYYMNFVETYVYDTSNYMNNLCWSYMSYAAAPASDPDNDGDVSYDTDADSGSGQAGAGEVSCSDPPAGATAYAYNSLGEMTSVTDPMGNVTSYAYNSNGEISSVTDPMGNTTSYGYDAYGDRNSVTDPLGNKTTSTYNADSQLTSSVPPDGNVSGQNAGAYTTSYTYEPSGQLKGVTAPGSRVTSYQYDAAGNLVVTTDPMSKVTTSTYDANGRLCWSYLGIVSAPSCGSPPSGATLHYYLDSTTTESSVVDPNGNATSYAYGDPAYPASPTSVTDALGNVTSIAYDPQGRKCFADPVNLYANGYMPLGYCPGTLGSGPAGSSAYAYDAVGNVTSYTDPSDNTTDYQYENPAYPHLVTSKSLPGTGSTSYTYNADGQVSTTTDAESNTLTYAYNADSKVCVKALTTSSITNCALPAGTAYATTYAYDPSQRLTAMVDYSPSSPSGATTSYGYDASSNLTSVTQSNNMSISYAWNPNNEVNCIGYPIPGTSTAGNCTQAPAPANPVVVRHHNADGQLASVEDFFGTVTSFGYGARGSLTSITYPSATGSSITYAYDQALNMTNENTTAPGQPTGTGDETWAYNADELRSAEYLNGSSTPSYSWSYNSRLMVTSNATTSFAYHNNGAIISSSSSQASTTFASTSWNSNGTQLCWSMNTLVSSPSCSSTPIGATDYSYTSDGQLSNISATTPGGASASYAWDPLGHMCWSAPSYVSSPTCSSPPSGATSYTYSGSGLRMSDTPPGGQVDNFAYDTATASVPAIIEDSTNAYIYGPQNTPWGVSI